MRIAFILKRWYTGKDVIADRYGRLYQLPFQLAKLGHELVVLCLDYRSIGSLYCEDIVCYPGTLQIKVIGVRGGQVLELLRAHRLFHSRWGGVKPDAIVGASDIPCVWMAYRISQRLNIPYIADLYDNYESFGQARIPGFRYLFKRSVAAADLVVTVSQALKTKIKCDYRLRAPIKIVPNGVDKSVFFAGDKLTARKVLGLPMQSPLIGTAGTLSEMKGIRTVYAAWERLSKEVSDIRLVLAGPLDRNLPLPKGPHVIYLGQLDERDVSYLFRALDVGMIPILDSTFGRFCFPQKAYEMLACRLPVVVSNVGAMSDLFKDSHQILYSPDNALELASMVVRQLDAPSLPNIKICEWEELIKDLEESIMSLTGAK